MKKHKVNRKRILFGVASVLLMLVFIFGIRYSLDRSTPYTPENTVSAMDDARSQVYVSGKDYSLNEHTKKEHKESEKKRSRILEEQAASHQQTASQKRISDTKGTNPVKKEDAPKKKPVKKPIKPPAPPKAKTPEKPAAPKEEDPDDEDEEDYYKKPESERKVLPTIKTSLRDGVKTKGETISFWVTATDYKKQNIPVFSNGDGSFNVLLNGTKLTSTGTSGNKTNFRPAVRDGKNIVKITAVDRRGYKRTITRRVIADTKQEAKPIGTVYVSISAPSLGIGTIASGIAVKITEQEPLHDVLRDAFKARGFSASMSSSYLKGISKSGIAKDAEITDEIRDKCLDMGITVKEREKWPDGWKNRLYEKDFTSASGWIYRVNGSTPGVGINAYIPDDGDEIELLFSLYDGDV